MCVPYFSMKIAQTENFLGVFFYLSSGLYSTCYQVEIVAKYINIRCTIVIKEDSHSALQATHIINELFCFYSLFHQLQKNNTWYTSITKCTLGCSLRLSFSYVTIIQIMVCGR